MAKKIFNMGFNFTSTKAYGDDYSIVVEISSHTAECAYSLAHFVGFNRFGAKFTDNCYDWKIV